MQFEAVIAFVFLVLYMLWAGIKAFFRWVTGEAKRERKDAAERQARIEAKRKFDEPILNGQVPDSEVLSTLADCDGNWDDIPVNAKEAFEELLWGTCTLREITYGDAVRIIRQRQRTAERAQQRAARVGLPGDDPDRPLSEPEALALLGVAPGCTSEELAHAYHLTMSQWHPDKLETMAPELREYATRRTARLNEAYRLIKSATVQHRMSGE